MDHQFELTDMTLTNGDVNPHHKMQVCKRCGFYYLSENDGTPAYNLEKILAKHLCNDELVRGIMEQ